MFNTMDAKIAHSKSQMNYFVFPSLSLARFSHSLVYLISILLKKDKTIAIERCARSFVNAISLKALWISSQAINRHQLINLPFQILT